MFLVARDISLKIRTLYCQFLHTYIAIAFMHRVSSVNCYIIKLRSTRRASGLLSFFVSVHWIYTLRTTDLYLFWYCLSFILVVWVCMTKSLVLPAKQTSVYRILHAAYVLWYSLFCGSVTVRFFHSKGTVDAFANGIFMTNIGHKYSIMLVSEVREADSM